MSSVKPHLSEGFMNRSDQMKDVCAARHSKMQKPTLHAVGVTVSVKVLGSAFRNVAPHVCMYVCWVSCMLVVMHARRGRTIFVRKR